VTLRLLYLIFMRVAGWIALLTRSAASRDAGIPVLRHELAVLCRTNPQPRPDWADRAVISALSRLLPAALPANRLVIPGTLPRRHQRLIRRHWTYPQRQERPPLNAPSPAPGVTFRGRGRRRADEPYPPQLFGVSAGPAPTGRSRCGRSACRRSGDACREVDTPLPLAGSPATGPRVGQKALFPPGLTQPV
jgi:hypothetical protein